MQLSPVQLSPVQAAANEIVVVSGADERYAMPLAVTIRSALDRLQADQHMRLFILDGGISDQSKQRLTQTWSSPRLSLTWLTPNVSRVDDLPVSDHISLAAYLRLMLPELLPADVSKVIYLDADMLVRRDLTQLWLEPLGDYSALAVQDYAAPFIDSSMSLSNFDVCNLHLAAAFPVANYRELGISADRMYFNSGLMVINIQKWRSENITGQVFDCLRTHRQHVLWWDQYALNVVLADKWRCLDHRWNQGAHIFVYPHWRESPFNRETYALLKEDPWVIHYCSPSKPWDYFCSHPFAYEFRRYLKQTAWHDFCPKRPERFVNAWWKMRYKQARNGMQTQLKNISYRRAA